VQKDHPFFLYLAYTIPHANDEATKALGNGQEVPNLGIYADKDWTEPNKGQAAMITRMDADIGRLFALLKKLGLDEKTIVLFSSDNGPHHEAAMTPHFFNASGGLRGIKRDVYEGGIREPFLVRWPGKIAAGKTSAHFGYFGDVMSTFAELTGATPPANLDSISFLPELLGQPQKKHDYLYWNFTKAGPSRPYSWISIGRPIVCARWRHRSLRPLHRRRREHNLHDAHPDLVQRAEELFKTARTENPDWPLRLPPAGKKNAAGK